MARCRIQQRRDRDRGDAVQVQHSGAGGRWKEPAISAQQGALLCHPYCACRALTLCRRPQVMIWDDHQNRCIGELSFRSEVKAVKLRRDRCCCSRAVRWCALRCSRCCCCCSWTGRVVVVLTNKIYVYNFADLRLLDHVETISNPHGPRSPHTCSAAHSVLTRTTPGLCALCPNSTNTVMACPGLHRGNVRVEVRGAASPCARARAVVRS